jgi:hypothetical protein
MFHKQPSKYEQEELFDDFKSLEIFLQLLGLVARENASYIATSESNIAAQVMDEESQPESSQEMDYMLNYKDSVVVKQCLQNVCCADIKPMVDVIRFGLSLRRERKNQSLKVFSRLTFPFFFD